MVGLERHTSFATTRQDEGSDSSVIDTGCWPEPFRNEEAERLSPALARTIEQEIIPRLMLAHRIGGVRPAREPEPAASWAASEEEIAYLAEAIVHRPLAEARSRLDAMRDDGLAVETIVLTVLPAVARHLGALWEVDRCTFVDVTIGVSRVQQLLRFYGPDLEPVSSDGGIAGRLLIAVVPGEQHTFGPSVVEEFFLRAGWEVESEFQPSRETLLGRVRDEWFDAVGLSCSGDVAFDRVPALLADLRRVSANSEMHIALGGKLFACNPALALQFGADSTASDGREALEIISRSISGRRSAS